MRLQSVPAGVDGAPSAFALFKSQACERLLQAYAPFDGVMSADDLVRRLDGQVEQPISKVARWIVQERLLHFTARGATCIPQFQFAGCELRPLLGQTLGELGATFDAFELAQWFVTPSAWIGDRLPAALVLAGDAGVLDAARADRYLASGS